jgi:hypothetical protein
VAISEVRVAPNGTQVTVEGVLTTPLGALEDGRGGFIADDSAGIAVLLPADPVAIVPSGTVVRAAGTVDDRYGQRTIRLDDAPTALATGMLPPPLAIATGAAGESLEGSVVAAEGRVAETPSQLTSGVSVSIDDGSGPLRVILAFAGASAPARDDVIRVRGPLGQRDTTGGGTTGYRVVVTDPSGLEIVPGPTPTPTPTPTPEPMPTPTPTPTPTPEPTPGPTPTPTPEPSPSATPTPSASPTTVDIATARAAAVGATVFVEGTVTAEAGRLGLAPLVAIQDATAAIVVRLPDGAARPQRGAVLRVKGKLADPYGQLEIRPATAEVAIVGSNPVPDPLPAAAAVLGEGVEARLVVIEGTLEASIARAPNGDVSFRLVDTAGVPLAVRAVRAAGIEPATARRGARLRVTGIVGQRATRKGALDGYRVWLRDAGDLLVVVPAPAATVTSGPSPTPAGPGRDGVTPVGPIRAALRLGAGPVRVEGVVTTAATLLDASGRRIIVQDASAAVEVLLQQGMAAPRRGSRVRVEGDLGQAYGAPRVKAVTVTVLGSGTLPAPRALAGDPGSADEGQLVRVQGTVVDLTRLGDRWRAEVRTSRATVVVAGLAGSGIPSATLREGAVASVVGVVRRPHPAASDRRFAVVPRSAADVRVTSWGSGRASGVATSSPGTGGWSGSASGSVSAPGSGAGSGATVGAGAGGAPVNADLARLAGMEGRRVRVGGLVVANDGEQVVIDDGTATGALRLAGEAAALLPLLEPGDAIAAAGRVLPGPEVRIEIRSAGDVTRLGDLGEALPMEAADHGSPTSPPPASPGPPAAASTGVEAGDGLAAGMTGSGGSPPGPGGGPLAAGFGLSLVVGAGWAGLAAARRRREQRHLAARISARLAGLP